MRRLSDIFPLKSVGPQARKQCTHLILSFSFSFSLSTNTHLPTRTRRQLQNKQAWAKYRQPGHYIYIYIYSILYYIILYCILHYNSQMSRAKPCAIRPFLFRASGVGLCSCWSLRLWVKAHTQKWKRGGRGRDSLPFCFVLLLLVQLTSHDAY